jgi:RAT1-interacting protein
VRTTHLPIIYNRLLLAAEMDCFEGNEPQLENYIEIKTYKVIDSDRANYTWQRFQTRNKLVSNFRYKLLKFWIQSFFVGVRTIVCGYRDSKGFVQKVEKLNTRDIPSMGRKYWDSWKCLSFADGLLTWVCNCIKEENVTYRMHYDGTDKVTLTETKVDKT